MKPLKPSHREKRRYLLLSGRDATQKAVEDAILKFVGILGYAKASLMVVRKTAKRIIISINRKELDKIRAALLMSGRDICVERVSGVVNKLK